MRRREQRAGLGRVKRRERFLTGRELPWLLLWWHRRGIGIEPSSSALILMLARERMIRLNSPHSALERRIRRRARRYGRIRRIRRTTRTTTRMIALTRLRGRPSVPERLLLLLIRSGRS